MKIDLYTKCILTIIAVALSLIAGQNLIPSVYASRNDVQKVSICTPDGNECAWIVGTKSGGNALLTVSARR